MTNDKTFKMINEPVEKLINHLAIPTIMSMLITSIYNMADTFFVAKINTSATAAVGVVFAIMALIQAIGFFCGHGSGNFISRMLGANKQEEAKRMAITGFVLAFCFGSILMILGLIFLKPLAIILGSTPTMLPYSMDYLKWILIGAPFMCASLVMNNQLRFQGNAFFAMIGITTGGVLNIILDPIFIFVFDFGIAGAAIATILSQAISFVILLIGIFKSDSLNYQLSAISINKYYLSQMVRGGFPSLCRQGISGISTAILNICTGPFGDSAIAGISIVTRLMQFFYSVVIGFGQGFQPVCGFNYGAKKYERVKAGFVYAVKVGTSFCIIVALVAMIFAPEIIRFIQGNEVEVIKVGTAALRFQALVFPLMAFVTMTNMMLQVAGKAVQASILASARQGIFLIPCVVILPLFLGVLGVEMAQMVADVVSFAIAIPFAKSFLKEIAVD